MPEIQRRIIMTFIMSPLIGENSASVGVPPGMNAVFDAKIDWANTEQSKRIMIITLENEAKNRFMSKSSSPVKL